MDPIRPPHLFRKPTLQDHLRIRARKCARATLKQLDAGESPAILFQYCVNSGMCLCEVALKAAKRLDELENTIAAGGIQKGGGLQRK